MLLRHGLGVLGGKRYPQVDQNQGIPDKVYDVGRCVLVHDVVTVSLCQ